MSDIAICWFRQDLRVADNPALFASHTHEQVLPIYILDDITAGEQQMGAASRVWLHHSLSSLNQSLDDHLALFQGAAQDILMDVIKRHQVKAIYWNRCYEPWRMARDQQIKTALESAGVQVESFNGSLLWEPWQIHKDDKTPYKVFTPFYRKGCLQATPPRFPIAKPEKVSWITDSERLPLADLALLPKVAWDRDLVKSWQIGEAGAHQRFADFLEDGMTNYKKGRDFPALKGVSRLSPHIQFGEISVHQIWHQVQDLESDKNTDHFCSELGWREFSYSQLYYNQNLPTENLQKKFDAFPWHEDSAQLKRWQKGKTGIPIVDAGMRELWQTGYMHNRVRMIVGSFLVKNLLLDWREGERWFWDTLFDADLANNSASWQWVAGCGADAAPYFRIFNPITQGERFDADGAYTRQYVPELKNLPDKYLFAPWTAPAEILAEAGVTLGVSYPKPIVDLKASRQQALDAFAAISGDKK